MQTRLLLTVALLTVELCPATAVYRNEASSPRHCCAVLELRQYTLKPGQRDALIALFDRHFVESQEALGMTIVGQFRDRRRADRFVWIRGFSDMQSRHTALEQFYGGPVWAEHKAAANATMVAVDDVYLLKPARPDMAFRLDVNGRPAVGEERKPVGVLAGIHHLRESADASVVPQFEERVAPELRRNGVRVESVFVTENAANTFTRLPVREGEHVLVWFGTVGRGDERSAQRLLAASVPLNTVAKGPPEVLELEATPRSLLGHHRAGH
jgi:NIPSNAP